MPANNDPIYSKAGAIGQNTGITAAQNTYDGTGANDTLVFTADAANGGFVQRLRFKAKGTNVATVARIYINNGSTNGTAANNSFYGEISLPATTASATAATPDVDYAMNIALPLGYRIYVGLGTAVAAGWTVTTIAGAY
jgi:hypothetical protein